MSKVKAIAGVASGILGVLSPKQPKVNIPKAELPPPAAPSTVLDTGQSVAVGSQTAVKNQRVSGRSIARRASGSGSSVLGGLGQSGLNI